MRIRVLIFLFFFLLSFFSLQGMPPLRAKKRLIPPEIGQLEEQSGERFAFRYKEDDQRSLMRKDATEQPLADQSTSTDRFEPSIDDDDFEVFGDDFDFEEDPLFKTTSAPSSPHQISLLDQQAAIASSQLRKRPYQLLATPLTSEKTRPLTYACREIAKLNSGEESNSPSKSELILPAAKKAKVFLAPEIRAKIVAITAEAYKAFLKKPQEERKKIDDRKYLQSVAARQFTKHGIKSAEGYQHISQIITAAKEKICPPPPPSEEEINSEQRLLKKLEIAKQQRCKKTAATFLVAEQEGREACLKLFSENPTDRNKLKDRPIIHTAIYNALKVFGIHYKEAATYATLKTTEIMDEIFPQHLVKEISSEARRLLELLEVRKKDGMPEEEARLAIAKEEATVFASRLIAEERSKNGTSNPRESYRNALIVATSRALRDLGLPSTVAFEQTSPIVTAILHELVPKSTRQSHPAVMAAFHAAKTRGVDPLIASIDAAKQAARNAYSQEINRAQLVRTVYHALMDCQTMDHIEADKQARTVTTEILNELRPKPKREKSPAVMADFEEAQRRGLKAREASLHAAEEATRKAYAENRTLSRRNLLAIAYHAIMDCETMKGADAKNEEGPIVTKVMRTAS